MPDEMDYIYEVYREKSFSTAAKKMYVTQPALSSAVRKAEAKIGAALFDRSTVPVQLTDAGKVYIQAVEQIRTIKEDMLNNIRDVSEVKTGHIIVSGENFVSAFILPEILMEFYKKYPGISVELMESNMHNLQTQLLESKTDLLIDYDFDPELYTSFPLLNDELLLAVPSDYPINRKLRAYRLTDEEIASCRNLDTDIAEVDIAQFAEIGFVMLKKGNDMNHRVSTLCEEAGISPKPVIYTDQLITAYNMARSGMGAAFITDTLVRSVREPSRCVFYKIAGQSAKRTLCIGYKKNRYQSRAVQAFIQTARDVYKEKTLP